MSRQRVEPLLSLAITPKTRADSDKLTEALKTLTTEDPTLRVTANDASDEVVIAVMTELHLSATATIPVQVPLSVLRENRDLP